MLIENHTLIKISHTDVDKNGQVSVPESVAVIGKKGICLLEYNLSYPS